MTTALSAPLPQWTPLDNEVALKALLFHRDMDALEASAKMPKDVRAKLENSLLDTAKISNGERLERALSDVFHDPLHVRTWSFLPGPDGFHWSEGASRILVLARIAAAYGLRDAAQKFATQSLNIQRIAVTDRESAAELYAFVTNFLKRAETAGRDAFARASMPPSEKVIALKSRLRQAHAPKAVEEKPVQEPVVQQVQAKVAETKVGGDVFIAVDTSGKDEHVVSSRPTPAPVTTPEIAETKTPEVAGTVTETELPKSAE